MANAHGTLVANTVTTVTMDAVAESPTQQLRPTEFEVLNRDGAAEIYFTVDGTTPTVGGAGCKVLPAAIGSYAVADDTSAAVTVKLISAGIPAYSVIGS